MKKASTISVLESIVSRDVAELQDVLKVIEDLNDRRADLEDRIWHIRETIQAVREADNKVVTSPQPNTVKLQVTDTAESIIRSKGPQHRRTLLSLIEAHGVIVGGRDPLNNMSAYLSRDDRFQASGDGIWSLAEQQDQAGEIAAD